MKQLFNYIYLIFNAYLTCMIIFYVRTAWDHIGYYTTLFKATARHKLETKILGLFYGYRIGEHI